MGGELPVDALCGPLSGGIVAVATRTPGLPARPMYGCSRSACRSVSAVPRVARPTVWPSPARVMASASRGPSTSAGEAPTSRAGRLSCRPNGWWPLVYRSVAGVLRYSGPARPSLRSVGLRRATNPRMTPSTSWMGKPSRSRNRSISVPVRERWGPATRGQRRAGRRGSGRCAATAASGPAASMPARRPRWPLGQCRPARGVAHAEVDAVGRPRPHRAALRWHGNGHRPVQSALVPAFGGPRMERPRTHDGGRTTSVTCAGSPGVLDPVE